jgi:hypothetical protein
MSPISNIFCLVLMIVKGVLRLRIDLGKEYFNLYKFLIITSLSSRSDVTGCYLLAP